MTGLKNVNGTWVVIHANGSVATTVDQDSAVWSAFKMLKTKGWKNRNILTLKPESVSGALTGKYTTTLLAFNESTSTSDLPNSVLGVSTAANRLSLIRFMLGASDEAQADPAAITSITTNRDSNMMGDIINSTPAIVEFPLSMVPSGSTLATFVSNNPSLTLRFRLIIVGDNQGILHGFGEVSGVDTSTGLIVGVVDELWGIIPPDLLGGLQTWRTGSKHLYMVDGSPSVYLYENATTANGLADGSDVLRVMVGLGKGGRSYYCLTLNGLDPSQPKVSWMVRPEDSSDATVHTMGFSSGQPVVARVFDGGVLKDAFFVSGGLSTTEVDSAFAAVAAYGSGTKLGRSILAFNTYNGSLIKKWDFVNDSTLKTLAPNMGGIPAEVVPVEALPGSNKTQRVYFTDTSGGAYALGTKASSGSRADSSEISSWSMRWIYKPAYSGTVVSTAPAVFPLSYGYPVLRSTAPTSIVQTFGVTLVAGDRNDPMDNDSINPGGGGTTYRNRLITILDRQDSADIATSATGGGSLDAKGSSDSDLMDLTTVNSTSDPKVDPSNSSYYPITKNGYFLNFNLGVAKSGSTTSWFYQKSVTSPMVLNNALFFTTFMPNVTSDICSGSGASYTYRMCQVLNPVYNSGSTQASTSDLSVCNGWIYRYNDIPSRLGNVGLSGVVQAGEVYNTDPSATGAQGQVSTNIGNLPTSPGIPRPRAWRIIR